MGTFKCGQKFQLSGAPSNTRQLSPVHVHRGGQFCTGTSVLTRRIGHGAHAVRAVKCVHSCMRNALRAPCEQMVGPSLGAGRLACVVMIPLSIHVAPVIKNPDSFF